MHLPSGLSDVICSSSWDPNLAASLSGLKSALDGGVYIATTEDHTRSNLRHARSTQDHKVRVSVDDTLRRLQDHTANSERHGGGSPSHDGAGRRAGPRAAPPLVPHTSPGGACVLPAPTPPAPRWAEWTTRGEKYTRILGRTILNVRISHF